MLVLPLVPAYLIGQVKLRLWKGVGNHEQQSRLDLLDLGEVLEHAQGHEFQLLGVGVLGALARLVVDDPCLALLAVDDQQVSDASVPHVLVLEATGFQVGGDTHLVLAQLLTFDLLETVQRTLGELEVLGDRGAVPHVKLSGLVETCAVGHGLALGFHDVLEHPQVEVLSGALLKELHATV